MRVRDLPKPKRARKRETIEAFVRRTHREARRFAGHREIQVDISVQPSWMVGLPLRQQSVLFLAARGPDGLPKHHPCKAVHVAYRASVFVASHSGEAHERELEWGEVGDSFMSLDNFADAKRWDACMVRFFDHHDQLPKHYYVHLIHGAEILGYKHPDERFRERWIDFYLACVESLHMAPETEEQMDARFR